MKQLLATFAILVVCACSPKKPVATGERPLFEILTQQNDGGANIRFYEILTEPREISMLKSDVNLKNKISDTDINSASFIILNMGEKATGGFFIGVESVVESNDKIIVTVKEQEPKPGDMTTMAITYPYSIVKINSKKPIEIK